jgi:GST-like protein
MLGQAHHFRIYAPEKIDYAINRYTNEARRLYGVMDQQLAGHKFIAGNQYTVADIAIFPRLRSWQNQGIDWADHPRLKDWVDRIAARPAVVRGVAVLADARQPLTDDKARDVLFGQTQYKKH